MVFRDYSWSHLLAGWSCGPLEVTGTGVRREVHILVRELLYLSSGGAYACVLSEPHDVSPIRQICRLLLPCAAGGMARRLGPSDTTAGGLIVGRPFRFHWFEACAGLAAATAASAACDMLLLLLL